MSRKLGVALLTAIGAVALVLTGVAGAAGPNEEVFQDSNAWLCEGAAGLPDDHCINAQSQGDTGVIKVFAPDPRWPQESISFSEKADSRPCPHDPSADPDGTWWQVPVPGGPYVCHHRPS